MRRSRMRLTSDADSYECHGPATNSPLILADGVSYMLQFSDGVSKDLQFEFVHLDPVDKIFARRLSLSETKFARLPGFSSGRIEVLARLRRVESGLRDFHKGLPPRLKDWTAEQLRSFFHLYPDAYGQAVRSAGDICYRYLWKGRDLERKKDLLAFLQREVDGMKAEDAQMLIEDLGCFSCPEYDDVKIDLHVDTGRMCRCRCSCSCRNPEPICA